MNDNKRKVTFLVSGAGGTMRFIYYAIEKFSLPFEIVAVVYTKMCDAVNFATRMSIPTYQVPYSRDRDTEMNQLLASLDSDVIITNFHHILSSATLASTKAHFINLHYSILPAYAGFIGMGQILAHAKERNIQIIGASCHEVDEIVDHGRVLCQTAIPPRWETSSDQEIMNRLYQASCLTLLNGLLIKFSLTHSPSSSQEPDLIISPPLALDLHMGSDDVWSKVSSSFKIEK